MNKLVRATEEHLKEILEDPRQEEIDEVYALDGKTIEEALRDSFSRSWEAYALVNDKTIFISGVVPYSFFSDKACPWLIGTNRVRENKKDFLFHSKLLVDLWIDRWKMFVNYVDARYEASVRWAKWVGFEVEEAKPFGYLQLPFHKIVMEKK